MKGLRDPFSRGMAIGALSACIAGAVASVVPAWGVSLAFVVYLACAALAGFLEGRCVRQKGSMPAAVRATTDEFLRPKLITAQAINEVLYRECGRKIKRIEKLTTALGDVVRSFESSTGFVITAERLETWQRVLEEKEEKEEKEAL